MREEKAKIDKHILAVLFFSLSKMDSLFLLKNLCTFFMGAIWATIF
jgi:hypothetical protein